MGSSMGELFVKVVRRVVCLLLFPLFSCFSRRVSNPLVHLTALALTLCAFVTAALAQEAQMQVMRHHVRPEITDHRATFMGRLPEDKQMHLSVVLSLRNQPALSSLLQRLYDPSSPDYRHFLTVAQFTEQFGPTEQDYAAVAAYLQSQGLTVEATPANRLVVPVSGSVAQIDSAFNLRMSTYQHPTEKRTFFSPDREPSLPLNLQVRHVTGLDNFSLPHPLRNVRMTTSRLLQ